MNAVNELKNLGLVKFAVGLPCGQWRGLTAGAWGEALRTRECFSGLDQVKQDLTHLLGLGDHRHDAHRGTTAVADHGVIRTQKGLSQDKLSKLAGVTLTTLVKIESGANDNPKIKTLKSIADALEVTVNDLLES